MKTTIEIADDLVKRAKALARRRGTRLRVVIEDGIRFVSAVDEAIRIRTDERGDQAV